MPEEALGSVEQVGQPVAPEPQSGTVTEQGGTIPQSGSVSAETEQPLSLTKSQLDQMIAQAINSQKQSWLNEAYQNTQSMNDKFERRVNEAIQTLKSAGIQADKAQAAKYLREQDKLAQANAQAQQRAQSQIDPAYQQFLQRFGVNPRLAGDQRLQAAYSLEQEYGIQLTREDPEYTEYFGDPKKRFSSYQFQRDYEKALEKKKARTAQDSQSQGNVAGLPSMSGVGKKSSAIPNTMRSSDIYDQAIAEMRNKR